MQTLATVALGLLLATLAVAFALNVGHTLSRGIADWWHDRHHA